MSTEAEGVREFPQVTNYNAVASNLRIARNGMLKSMGSFMDVIRGM
jgi:hypothetical protein